MTDDRVFEFLRDLGGYKRGVLTRDIEPLWQALTRRQLHAAVMRFRELFAAIVAEYAGSDEWWALQRREQALQSEAWPEAQCWYHHKRYWIFRDIAKTRNESDALERLGSAAARFCELCPDRVDEVRAALIAATQK